MFTVYLIENKNWINIVIGIAAELCSSRLFYFFQSICHSIANSTVKLDMGASNTNAECFRLTNCTEKSEQFYYVTFQYSFILKHLKDI